MLTCANCGEQNPERARFCLNCGAALVAEQRRGARKVVTVVVCDVSGSTALGERLDPESLSRVMARFFERTRAVLERHHGLVQKFIGDAVVATFGVPVVREDDALRAVRAAAAMQDAVAELDRGGRPGDRGPHRGRHRGGDGRGDRRRPAGHRRGRQPGHPAPGGRRPRGGAARPPHLAPVPRRPGRGRGGRGRGRGRLAAGRRVPGRPRARPALGQPAGGPAGRAAAVRLDVPADGAGPRPATC